MNNFFVLLPLNFKQNLIIIKRIPERTIRCLWGKGLPLLERLLILVHDKSTETPPMKLVSKDVSP